MSQNILDCMIHVSPLVEVGRLRKEVKKIVFKRSTELEKMVSLCEIVKLDGKIYLAHNSLLRYLLVSDLEEEFKFKFKELAEKQLNCVASYLVQRKLISNKEIQPNDSRKINSLGGVFISTKNLDKVYTFNFNKLIGKIGYIKREQTRKLS